MSSQLFDAIEHLGKEKGIDKEVLIEALEAALISAYKKNFKSATNVRVELDENAGTMKVYSRKTVVEEVLDPQQEISLDEAKKIEDLKKEYGLADEEKKTDTELIVIDGNSQSDEGVLFDLDAEEEE